MTAIGNLLILVATGAAAFAVTLPAVHPDHSAGASTASALRLSRGFEQNAGQSDPRVRFLLRGVNYGIFLTPSEAVLSFVGNKSSVLRLGFPGAHPSEISGLHPLPGRIHYLTVGDPAKRPSEVAAFGEVRYQDLFPGVDLIFHRGESSLEYDFQVAPYADPGRIRVQFKGALNVAAESSGDLLISLSGGRVRMRRPEVYQWPSGEKGQKILVPSRYVIEDDEQVSFQLGSYDRSRPLLIDPILSYSTYLGGSGNDSGAAVALDQAGNAYVTGQTISSDFPLSGPEQVQISGQTDVFVTKINAAGTAWIYSTYLGGSGNDGGSAIAVDASGNAYVAGLTESYDFPVEGPYQGVLSGVQDAFVAKLDPTGSRLIYSTFLGGSGAEAANGIAVDSTGSAVVAGSTSSSNFPLRNPLQSVLGGGNDGFVTKLAPSGASLVYSTYLGGSGNDSAAGIALDPVGNAYVAGQTSSPNFHVVNALFTSLSGSSDAFVAKINSSGTAFGYSTFLGGSGADGAYGIAVDAADNAVVVGATTSANFPVKNALRSTAVGGGDAFVTKLNASGSVIIYSTYLGGTGSDTAWAVALDSNATAYVAGSTTSTDFPVSAAVQSSPCGAGDAFVTAIAATGAELLYSTFLCGGGSDSAQGIATDTEGNVVVAGVTASGAFPVGTALQPYLAGGQDAFVSRIFQNGPVISISPATLTFPNSALGTPTSTLRLTVSNVGNQPAVLSAFSVTGDFSQTNACGSSLAAGASCSVLIDFKATVAGLRKGAISVAANTSSGLYVIPLSGTGITPVPLLTALSPLTAAPGSSLLTIVVEGSGFQPGAVVNWNGSPRPTTFVSSTRLVVQIQTADLAAAGTAAITVTNPVDSAPALANAQVFLTGTGRGVTASDWSQPSVILYNREDANKCVQVHSIPPTGTGDLCLTCGSTGFGGGIAFHNGKLSPDGKWIAMQVTLAASSGCDSVDGGPGSGNNQEVWIASYPNLAQTQLRVSPTCVVGRCANLLPIWNPQGTSIAFGNRQSYCTNPGPPDCAMKMAIANISFSGGVPVLGSTNFIDVNASNPGIVEPWSWKPDGSVLYFTGHDATHPYPSVTVNSLTGNSVAVLTPVTGSDVWNEFPTAARGGTSIFFSSSRANPQECNLPGCPSPIFPLDEIYSMNADGSKMSALTGLNTPGSPDYRGGNPAAANGITLSPSAAQGLIDEETPGTAKWITMATIVWPPSVTSNPLPFSVQAPAPVSFNRLDLPVQAVPGSVVAADLNGDGKPDLAVVNTASGAVSVFSGNGDGTFGPGLSLTTASSPMSLAIGDFNGDGIPDIATANNGTLGVSVLLSGPNGSYYPHADYASGVAAVSIAAGDVNLDGKLDLITANAGSGTISVLLGNGDGTFQPAVSYLAGTNPTAIILGDFNGDSLLDVAVINSMPSGSSTVSVMLGTGNGSFPHRVPYATGINSWSGVAADLNSDGKLDLVVVNSNIAQSPNGDSVSVLLGNGDGTFRAGLSYATGKNPYSVAIADFSRDGHLDLAVANRSANTISLLIGNGDGTFQQKTDFAVTQMPVSLASQDLDGDGRADLVVASGTNTTISLLFQNTALFSPRWLTFSDTTVGQTSGPLQATFTNLTSSTLNISSITASGDFSQTNTCGGNLAAGMSCGVEITFKPSAPGIRSGALTVTNASSFSPWVAKLSGNAQAPVFTVTLSPSSVIGGTTTTANTVSLVNPASPGLTCTLSSSNPSVALPPSSVSIASGATVSPFFSIVTYPVQVPAVVNIFVTCGSAFQSIPMGILPATLAGLAVSPAATYGGLSTQGTLTLTGPAASNGATILLSSSNPQVASVPSSVTIAAGAVTSSPFTIATAAVAAPTSVTITATYGTSTTAATLQVVPAALYALRLSPATIGGGLATKSNSLSLIGVAPVGGATVLLVSSNPSVASVPASVAIAAGASISPTFTIGTAAVAAPVSITVTASYGGSSKAATLTVNPPSLYGMSLTSTSVSGGSVLAGNVTSLNGVAPAGGVTVQLASSNPSIASLPPSVHVAAGATYSATFSVTTHHVAAATPITLTATWGNEKIAASVTVTP